MARAIRIGILNDMAEAAPGPGDIEHWLRFAVDEVIAQGRIDRPVEFVHGWGLGLPMGTAAAVERGFAKLVDDDVLMIVGPAIGDNALVAAPLAGHHRVPAINWAGAERARNEYMFHLQVGSHEDESIVLVRHLARVGAKRIGVVHDRSPIGLRHMQFFQAEADIAGVDITASASLSPLAEDADAIVARIVGTGVDAVAYLGLGLAVPAVARALAACGWDGPRAMNTAGIRGYYSDFASSIDGWTYVDMHSDTNATLLALRERAGVAPARSLSAAKGYDLGRLVAEGLARAPSLTRDGMKEGLELVKYLPAAEGHEGTLLGFGRYDRGALHGRYLVLRRWQDGETVEIAEGG
jgi:ABC-type branched-subunit amino acid transport system substrate-binding protein